MNRFRVRKTADTLIIQSPHEVAYMEEGGWIDRDIEWRTVAELDRVWAANLAAELDAWLAGTDHIPDLETP